MNRKLVFISFLTLCNLIFPITSNNTCISKNGHVLRSNSSDSSIETTNVLYDLRILYGGDNYLGFDWTTLYPNPLEDKEQNFKFYRMVPVDNKLYLYVYYDNDEKYSLDNTSTFRLSLSNSKDSSGNYIEDYKNYSARLINTYGTQHKFIKYCIDDIDMSSGRVFIKSMYIRFYNKFNVLDKTKSYEIEDELIVKENSSTDFVYDYFKNDYVRVTDGEVGTLITRIDSQVHILGLGNSIYGTSDYYEDFYYFFSTDHEIDELLEIQYDYELIEYTEKHYSGRKKWNEAASWTAYLGLYAEALDEDHIVKDSVSIKSFPNNIIKSGSVNNPVSRPYFLFWNKDYDYTLENIQNAEDLSNLDSTSEQPFKEFIDNVQINRLNNGKEKYHWAFRVCSSLRHTYYDLETGFPLFGDKVYGVTDCHEVKQTMITYLKFRKGFTIYEKNVLDTPKDVTFAYVDEFEYPDLMDDIQTTIKSLKDNGKNFIKFLGVALSIILSAGLIILIIKLVNYLKKYNFYKKKKRKKHRK